MDILIIGLGSMGKRRIRNLQALGYQKITGFDLREDRRLEAERLYGIDTIDTPDDLFVYDAVFICVPPDLHMLYMQKAYENNVHAFIEAGIFDDGLEELAGKVRAKKLVFYPSSTMMFHPSVKKMKQLVDEGSIGKLLNFSYHTGSYLPDWHPWEGLGFYASNHETGACREMTLFDLSWINWIIGEITEIKSFYSKTSGMKTDADDVYALALKYKNGVIATCMTDIVSRNAIRSLIINGEKGQIQWDWYDKAVKLFNGEENSWIHYLEPAGSAVGGYHTLIIEEMYIDEVKSFISAIENGTPLVNTLEDDLRNISYLHMIESNQMEVKNNVGKKLGIFGE